MVETGQHMPVEEVAMSSRENAPDTVPKNTAIACPLASPLTARFPGLLALAAVPAAILVNPFFFGLAGGLLAAISLLLSPPRCRCLGVVGLIAAAAGGGLGLYVPH